MNISPQKPPLCKGRWHGVAVTVGLLQSPSLLRSRPPLGTGAFRVPHPPLFVYFDEFRYKSIDFPLYFCEIFHYNDTIIWERGFWAWAN